MAGMIFYNAKASCKGCTDRHINCHDHCERYKAFKQACEEERKARMMANMKDEYSRPLTKRRSR